MEFQDYSITTGIEPFLHQSFLKKVGEKININCQGSSGAMVWIFKTASNDKSNPKSNYLPFLILNSEIH
jgi:hypothetical protein